MALFLVGCHAKPRPKVAPLTPSAPLQQRLKVRAVYDTEYAGLLGAEARIRDRISAASTQLSHAFGLELEVTSIERWHPKVGRDSEALLQDLEKTEPGDADLVLGFTNEQAPRRPTMSDLARSRYAGRHLLLRSLAGNFSAEQQDALHWAEVRSIQHGLGTLFGALPACGHTVMATRPALTLRRRPTFSALNTDLITLHAALDLKQTGAVRVPKTMAKAVVARLEAATPAERRCAEGRLNARRDLLLSVSEQAEPKPAPTSDPVAVGLAKLAAGDPAGAFAVCAPAAETAPTSPAVRCAGLAADAIGDNANAIRFLRAHLAHQPDDETVLVQLARALGRDGDDAGARALLTRYVASHPKHSKAGVNLGIARARMGDLDGARRAWRAVLKHDPEHADAKRLLADLERALRR